MREKENQQKEQNNKVPDYNIMPRKERVLHGRRASAQDVEEPCCPDSSRLESAESEKIPAQQSSSLPQPSFHRGRRNNWQLKQGEVSEKIPANMTQPCDNRHSPLKAGLSLKDAYRREGKILQARKASNSQSAENGPRKWHDTYGAPNDLLEQPLYSVIGEEERLKIQSLCPPSLAQKMNFTHAPRLHQDMKPLKPQPIGHLATRKVNKSGSSKEPPPAYPFWTEAKELSSSQHRQERNPVDYRRSRACC